MSKAKQKIYTKRAMQWTSVYLSADDRKLWIAAASKLGVSLSEFFRKAIRKEATRALNDENSRAA
jgi:uncharacterized protein (DUF1778 family)